MPRSRLALYAFDRNRLVPADSLHRHAVAIAADEHLLEVLDHRRLFLLDHLLASFRSVLIPSSEVAAGAFGRGAGRDDLTPALRQALHHAARCTPRDCERLVDGTRGLVVCPHPRDMAQAQSIARRTGTQILALLDPSDEENQPYALAPRGQVAGLVAMSFDEMVAGAALGLDSPILLVMVGAAAFNRAAITPTPPNAPHGTMTVGICPTASLAPYMAPVTTQVGRFAGRVPGARRTAILTPPDPRPRGRAHLLTGHEAPEPLPIAGMAGWADIFALVAGGATESDEEAILMAMEAGVPVLALDGPVSRTLIRQGHTGYLFSPYHFDEIPVRLSLLARLRDEYDRVTEAARQWVHLNASPGAARAHVTSLVRSIIVSHTEYASFDEELFLGGGMAG